MSLAVAASAPADVGIMTAAASVPSMYYCSSYRHHSDNGPFASAPSPPGDDARRRFTPYAHTSEILLECNDDDEVLKIRQMQDENEVDHDDRNTVDVQLDAKVSMELPLSPASCVLSDSFCCFSDDMMEEADPHPGLHHHPNLPMERPRRRPHQCQGGQPIGVRIDEGRNTYHSPPNHKHPGVPKFPVSFMVQMGLAEATSEESGQDAMEEVMAGGSSWLQATDYAAIKRDNVKTLLTIQQRIQNPASQHLPIISIVDGCVVDNSNDVVRSHREEQEDDDVCPRGLETVIEKLIRGAKTGDNRASISHQRRVSQLIVQLYRTHRSLRSKPYQQQHYYRDEARARAFPRKQSSAPGAGNGLATSSSSTLEDDIRAMYEMVSQTDRIRALSLADQDARDVGHRGSVSCCDL